MSIISNKTLETLFKHIGLDHVDPDDEKQVLTTELRLIMDRKLNDRKLDVKGAKPNKIKKSLVPEKAEVLSNFEDAISEENDGEYKTSEDEEDQKDNKKADSEDEKKDKKK